MIERNWLNHLKWKALEETNQQDLCTLKKTVSFSIPNNREKNYLKFGIGYACAGQSSVNPESKRVENIEPLKIVGNFGRDNPIGSIID